MGWVVAFANKKGGWLGDDDVGGAVVVVVVVVYCGCVGG